MKTRIHAFPGSPILLLIVGSTLLRLGFAAATGLGIDESYMVTAGRVLSLGYFDHPPASWWLSWGSSHLFDSETPLTVRLPFVLLFAVSQTLVWRITRIVANQRSAFWAVVALNLSPVFSVTTGTWVLPDGPLDTALLGATLCLLHALPATGRRSAVWWAGAGVCSGLALFSKYSAVLTIGGAFLYLASSPRHRHWLLKPAPYLAVILAVGMFSPVVLWNATHQWASFAFQGDRAGGSRLQILGPVQTLAGEALFVLPWVWVPMMILLIEGFRRDAAWPRRLLAWLGAPPIAGFALVAAWSSRRILYHWAAPGYLMLFPLLGEAIADRLDYRWVKRLLVGSTALVLMSLAVIVAQLQFDVFRGSLGSVLRNDPTVEGLDWISIREDLQARGVLPPGALVGSFNWRDAGKVGYALGPAATMLCLNPDARQFAFAHPLSDYAGENVLLLAVYPPGASAASDPAGLARRWFREVETLPDTSVRLQGRILMKVAVLRGHGLRSAPR